MKKNILFMLIFIFLFSGCANLESYLQKGNYKDAKDEALYMDSNELNDELDNGSTHLIETIKYDKPELEIILIKRGANIYKRDKNGFSPLYYAIKSSDINTIKPILNKIIKDKNEQYINKELAKYHSLKPFFIKELPELINYDYTFYKIMTIPNLFTSKDQEKIFSNIVNKEALIKHISNKYYKLLSAILNYSIKTKNYAVLNALSSKAFIYDINYSMPNVKNTIKYVKTVEKKYNREWGYVTDLVNASTPEQTILTNFSKALNIGVKKYLSPNKILIGKYNIRLIDPDDSLVNYVNLTTYKKTNNYFLFGIKIKPLTVIGGGISTYIELKNPSINDAKWYDITKLITLDGKVIYSKNKSSKLQPTITLSGKIIGKHTKVIYKKLSPSMGLWENGLFYFDKFYSLAQVSTFRGNRSAFLPFPTKIELAEPITIPHFIADIKRGKFESSKEFKQRVNKINKQNEKKLADFVNELHQRVKTYQNTKKLFTYKNIQKTTNKIKNKILETTFKHKLFNYSYDADKEIYTINIKIWTPKNIGKSFNVDYTAGRGRFGINLLSLDKIKCIGNYGNGIKLFLNLSHDYETTVKFSEWVPGAKDFVLEKYKYDMSFIYPGIYKKTFNLFSIYSGFYNLDLNNIKNPCVDTKILTLKLPIKRNLAPLAKKILSRKYFQPTLIFRIENNKLKLIGIKELQKFVKGESK